MNKKIRITISAAIAVIVIAAGGFSIYMVKRDKIAPNTIINGVDVGGLTKDEAKSKIKIFTEDTFNLEYNEKSYSIELKDIDFKYNLDKTVQDAYDVNRKEGTLKNMVSMLGSRFGHKENIYIATEYNQKKADNEIKEKTKEINKEKEDARFETSDGKTTLKKDVDGISVNIEKTRQNMENSLSKNKFESEVAVDTETAEITTSDLKGIDSVLGTSMTTFRMSDENRSHNIRVATEASSKVILKPGQEYSFNGVVGKRSAENGYKNAPVIMEGEMEQDLGGGVCQVSSTLYNAVLKSGLEIVNVKNHSIPSSYVGMGRDATVTDSGIDFVFKNPYKHNIYIQNYVSGDTIVCQVFGNSSDEQNVEITTSVIGVNAAQTKEVEKKDLEEGKKEEDKSPRNGYTVVTYRIFKDKNGKQIKKEKISTSYYPKRDGLVYVGTKPKEEEKPETKPEEKPSTGDENQATPDNETDKTTV